MKINPKKKKKIHCFDSTMVKSGCLRVDFHPSVETLRSQHRHWRPLAGDLKLKKKNLGTSRVKIHWLSSAPHLYVMLRQRVTRRYTFQSSVFPAGWDALLLFLLPGGGNALEKHRPSHHIHDCKTP